jgi:NAD(P)-dependent dehydrogenase (short-subunit alcohol dehydrogenase family)
MQEHSGVTFDFSGKVAMVTGGAGNLGHATALAFAAAGAHVVVVDRNAARQAEAFAAWRDDAQHWLAAPVDVLEPESAAQAVHQTVDRFGRLDVLINTVGGYQAGDPVHELDLATWDQMLDLNARSTLIMCRAAVPQMLAQGSGKIVNVAARAGLAGTAHHAAYAASKAAVVRLTETLAAELRSQGINANVVLPGAIDTPENRAAMPKADTGKWVAPASLADVILFLASPAARDIHGAAIPVYGLG